MRYPNVCYIDIENKDIIALAGLTAWVVRQANISTRYRIDKWEMRLSHRYLRVRFTRKGDCDDFKQAEREALRMADEASLQQQDPLPPQDAVRSRPNPAFDWNGYVDRIVKLPRR